MRFKSLMLVILCTLFTSVAQIFFKLGSGKLVFDLIKILTNHYLIIGIILYGIGAVLLLLSLKIGELSVVYPVIATSYIWVSILSFFIFNESITLFKSLGVASIIGGVAFLSLNGR